jgi:hypothetical protein
MQPLSCACEKAPSMSAERKTTVVGRLSRAATVRENRPTGAISLALSDAGRDWWVEIPPGDLGGDRAEGVPTDGHAADVGQ